MPESDSPEPSDPILRIERRLASIEERLAPLARVAELLERFGPSIDRLGKLPSFLQKR